MRSIKEACFGGVALTALWMAITPIAIAQDDEQGEERREDVVLVVGSYVQGHSEDGALPVDVFSTDELDAKGVDSPLEFIKSLPSVGTVLGDSNQFRAGTEQGVGSINLRNLGRERTLVLFNGRRFIPTPGDGAADTQLIPLFALERVEILKDGAASTYGSDAIAGVANFATRQNFDGIELSIDRSFVQGSDDNTSISFLAGKNFSKGNLLFGAGYQQRSELQAKDRDFTSVPYDVNPSGWSPLSSPGLWMPKVGVPSAGDVGTTLGLGIDGALTNACAEMGGVNGAYVGLPVCRYNYIPFDNLIEDEERFQIYGQADWDLTDDLSFHAEALFSKTTLDNLAYSPSYPPTQGPNGPGSTYAFYVPSTNPGYADYLTQTFDPAVSIYPYYSNYSVLLLGRPFALGGNPMDPSGAARGFAENEATRISAGFEKSFTDNFRGQLYATWQRSDRSALSPDIIGERLQAALNGFGGDDCAGTTAGQNGCLWFNPFINAFPGNPALGLDNPAYIPGNENEPEVIEWFQSQSGAMGREDQLIIDAIFSGETELKFAGSMPLNYAFGAQYRDSEYSNTPLNKWSDPDQIPCATEGDFTCLDDPNDTNFPTGPFIFLGQYPRETLTQDVYAFFAEGNLLVTDALEVTLAARFEDYGDPVGSTFNPKLSARWAANDVLTLRGSVGTTFRGPLPADLTLGGSTGVAPINAAGRAYKATQYMGNPDLDPETAFTTNFGIIFDNDSLRLSVDYWSYDFEGQFEDLPFQAIADALISPTDPTDGSAIVDCSSAFTQFVIFDGGSCVQGTTIAGDIARINTLTVNGPDVKTDGLDFAASYTSDMSWGRLTVGANATLTLNYDVSNFEYNGLTFTTAYDAVGYTNYDRFPGTMSEWRGNVFATLNMDLIDVNYNATYIGGVDNNECPSTGPCTTTEFGDVNFGRKVDSYLQHDISAAYTTEVSDHELIFRVGIENFTNEAPSTALLPLGYDPYIGNPAGRVVKVSAKARF